jgi:hypothetical protein
MSKSVVGLLAGLAVLAAAGRARRGSFALKDAPVVGLYETSSGKVGMEIRRSPSGTYRYTGAWGAGSGHSHETMARWVRDELAYRRGVRTVVDFFAASGSSAKDPYKQAYEQARGLADRMGRDVGIMKNAFGGYSVFALPNPENRRGHELRCEVVRPGSPRSGSRSEVEEF